MTATRKPPGSRRAFLAATVAAASVLPLGRVAQARETVRISFQRSSTLLTLLKQNGTLERGRLILRELRATDVAIWSPTSV